MTESCWRSWLSTEGFRRVSWRLHTDPCTCWKFEKGSQERETETDRSREGKGKSTGVEQIDRGRTSGAAPTAGKDARWKRTAGKRATAQATWSSTWTSSADCAWRRRRRWCRSTTTRPCRCRCGYSPASTSRWAVKSAAYESSHADEPTDEPRGFVGDDRNGTSSSSVAFDSQPAIIGERLIEK